MTRCNLRSLLQENKLGGARSTSHLVFLSIRVVSIVLTAETFGRMKRTFL